MSLASRGAEFFRFCIVGGLTFLVDYGLLFLLTSVLDVHYLWSSAWAFIVAVIVNYYLCVFFGGTQLCPAGGLRGVEPGRSGHQPGLYVAAGGQAGPALHAGQGGGHRRGHDLELHHEAQGPELARAPCLAAVPLPFPALPHQQKKPGFFARLFSSMSIRSRPVPAGGHRCPAATAMTAY